MTMPAAILWEYLVNTAGLFTDPDDGIAWPLYINTLPDGNGAQDVLASVSDTAGLLEGKSMRGNLDQHFGIQIRVRARTDMAAHDKIKAVETALAPVHNAEVTLESGVVWWIGNLSQAGTIVKIGPDDKERSNYTLNYLMSVTEI